MTEATTTNPTTTTTPAPTGTDAGAAATAVVTPAEGAATTEPAAAAGEGDAGDQVTSLANEGGKGADAAGEGEGKAEGEGAADPAGVLGAPEAYELTAPEGMTFDAEAFGVVEPVLRELNLSATAAQKLVDAYGGKVIPMLAERAKTQAAEAVEANNVAYRADLAAQAKADPEIGGAKMEQTLDRVAQVWDQFGIKKGEGFRQLLDDSGLGNHPDMLRFLSRVGSAVGEGSFVPPSGGGAGGRKSDTEVFYGNGAAG